MSNAQWPPAQLQDILIVEKVLLEGPTVPNTVLTGGDSFLRNQLSILRPSFLILSLTPSHPESFCYKKKKRPTDV